MIVLSVGSKMSDDLESTGSAAAQAHFHVKWLALGS